VIGDGPARAEVLSAFSAIAPDRIDWLGELEPEAVAAELVSCDLYVWPGTGEAYGLAYLEAQAMGLPVVAQRTDGVPAVVEHGVTGWLTPAGDITAFAAAIERLLRDPALRASMGAEASRFVREKRSLAAAAGRIGAVLAAVRGSFDGARA
jgi:glycosyltransferase involved in cell wall biosynthesis